MEQLSFFPEKLLDVVAGLGRRLDEHDVELLGLALAVLGGDLPLVREVRLVPHQHDDHIRPALRPNVVDPFRGLMKQKDTNGSDPILIRVL